MSTKIIGLEELNKKLKRLEIVTSPAQMKSTMHTIGNMIRNIIEESFENQADPWGTKWKPLKPQTIRAKKGKGKILRAKGNLEDKWHITATPTSVEVSNNSTSPNGYHYGIVHQWGSKRKNIPARPFLPLEDDGSIMGALKDDIEDVVTKRLQEALR